MTSKTYKPGLRIVMGVAHRYGAKWTSQLNASLSPTEITCLNAALTAIAALLACLGPKPPPI
jgi:hypothetical protein